MGEWPGASQPASPPALLVGVLPPCDGWWLCRLLRRADSFCRVATEAWGTDGDHTGPSSPPLLPVATSAAGDAGGPPLFLGSALTAAGAGGGGGAAGTGATARPGSSRGRAPMPLPPYGAAGTEARGTRCCSTWATMSSMLRVTRAPLAGGVRAALRTVVVPLIRRPSPLGDTAVGVGGAALGEGAGNGEGGASRGDGAAMPSSAAGSESRLTTNERLTLALRATRRLWRRAATVACCAAWAARPAASAATEVARSTAGGAASLWLTRAGLAASPLAWLPLFSAAISLAWDKPLVAASCGALRCTAPATTPPSGGGAASPLLLLRGAVLGLGTAAAVSLSTAASGTAGGVATTAGATLSLPLWSLLLACCTGATTAATAVSLTRPGSGCTGTGGATRSGWGTSWSLLLVRLTRTRTTAPVAELALTRGCTVMLALGCGASASTSAGAARSADSHAGAGAVVGPGTLAASWGGARPPWRAGGVQSVGSGTCLRSEERSTSSSSMSSASSRHEGVARSPPTTSCCC